jgi:uncharacterized protein YjbI with pentapeptide repeats
MAAQDDNSPAQHIPEPPTESRPYPVGQEALLLQTISRQALQIETLRTEVLGQEHRFFSVIENAWLALRPRDGWTGPMRRAAIFALFRYFISPRAALVVSLSIGGVVGVLLAWQTNALLEQQNEKIELQSHLDIVSLYASYAQRNAQLLQSSQSLFDSIGTESAPKDGGLTPSQKAQLGALMDGLESLPFSNIVLIKELPRRIEMTSENAPRERSPAYRFLENLLGRPEKSGFQRSLDEIPVPIPSGGLHNAERGQIIFTLFALGARDFANLNLQNADLIAADLRGSTLDKANLHHADLTKANLAHATFTNANLSRASLSGANLTGANLANANLDDTNLRDAKLTGANLAGAGLSRAYLGGANLRGAELFNAFLGSATLIRAQLSKANLTEASLMGAELSGADLTGANLTDALLINANLSEANLTGANLSGADLSGADFTGTRLTEEQIAAIVCERANPPKKLAGLKRFSCNIGHPPPTSSPLRAIP